VSVSGRGRGPVDIAADRLDGGEAGRRLLNHVEVRVAGAGDEHDDSPVLAHADAWRAEAPSDAGELRPAAPAAVRRVLRVRVDRTVAAEGEGVEPPAGVARHFRP